MSISCQTASRKAEAGCGERTPSSRILLIGGGALTVGALALGWPYLAAAGLVPLVLSVLPCLAMCALHLCRRPGAKPEDAASTALNGGQG